MLRANHFATKPVCELRPTRLFLLFCLLYIEHSDRRDLKSILLFLEKLSDEVENI